MIANNVRRVQEIDEELGKLTRERAELLDDIVKSVKNDGVGDASSLSGAQFLLDDNLITLRRDSNGLTSLKYAPIKTIDDDKNSGV